MGYLFCQIEVEPQKRSKEQIIYQHKKPEWKQFIILDNIMSFF